MSSKVTAKLRLGAAFSVLLISLTLLAGCKQEADNSYTPPGYGASVGPLTDTVWQSGSDTIRFGAEGKVTTVPDSWKKDEFPGFYLMEYGDFTYSGTDIHAKVTNVQAERVPGFDVVEKGTTIPDFATFTVPTTTTTNQDGQSNPVTNYYEMKVTIKGKPTTTFTMENRPTSEDAFVGTYYDERGRKAIQINKDDSTFVTFTNGEQTVQYWKYNGDGTISVTPFTNNSMGSSTSTSSTIYYLYPHALMSNRSAVAWK